MFIITFSCNEDNNIFLIQFFTIVVFIFIFWVLPFLQVLLFWLQSEARTAIIICWFWLINCIINSCWRQHSSWPFIWLIYSKTRVKLFDGSWFQMPLLVFVQAPRFTTCGSENINNPSLTCAHWNNLLWIHFAIFMFSGLSGSPVRVCFWYSMRNKWQINSSFLSQSYWSLG